MILKDQNNFNTLKNAIIKGINILVVEDEPAIIDIYTDYLSGRYNVTITTNGSMSIGHIMNKIYDLDLILLDYKLPDMSGLEILIETKKLRPSLPIIIVTAFGNEDVAVKAFRYGAREYIKKPFTRDELIKKIDFCVGLKLMASFPIRKVLTSENYFSKENMLKAKQYNVKIEKAVQYINHNFSQKLTLDLIADGVCMSRYHFSRSFKKSFGCSYQDYVNRVRISEATKLLSEKDLTITEVAFSVGYSDLTHFARIFKKEIGYTPSAYRKMILAQALAGAFQSERV